MKRKIGRGTPLEEQVKGSYEYLLGQIRQAFYEQFGRVDDWYPYVVETFTEYLIVKDEKLAVDEYYLVTYSRDANGAYTFAARDAWEIVELAYQPATRAVAEESRNQPVGDETRFTETVHGAVRLEEAKGEDGARYISGIGLTADIVNANGRIYPRAVVQSAVEAAQGHLSESLGQGRLAIVGEAEHPSQKGQRPRFLETIVKWTKVGWDESRGQVEIRGRVLDTSQGRDAVAIMEGGVYPAISFRGYGTARMLKLEDGTTIEEVTDLVITGFDLLSPGEQSDPNAGILVLENKSRPDGHNRRLSTMDPKELIEALKKEGIWDQLTAAVLSQFEEAQKQRNAQERDRMLREALGAKDGEDLLQAARRLVQEHKSKPDAQLEKQLRAELGIGETDDLAEALRQRAERLQKLEEAEQKRAVAAYVEQETKDLKYPDWMKVKMVEAIQAGEPKSIEEAKRLIVSKRKEYDALMAELELRMKGRGAVEVLGPVLERETGTPDYARVSFELTEGIRQIELSPRRDFRKPRNVNEEFTALYLAKFDEQYKAQLLRELRAYEEAEQTSDLNLPYSVSRAVVAEAFPRLVASGIFDFGLTDQSPSRIYYEAHAGETGYTATVTDEAVTSDEGAWVDLDYKRVTPGTVVVTSSPAGTTYVEGTDYVIDYANGKLFTITAANGGSIGDATALLVDYGYTAIRKGEMATIERAKVQLSYKTLEILADRLATQISSEAIVFSRSQIGWDAVARTLNSLVRQVTRKIDQGAIYMALAAALKVASNSGGTWTAATDPVSEFVEKVGVAKIKVLNRYYDPTFLLLSATNADKIANWDGFTQAGSRPDADLSANGFIGRLKGMPVFQSTEMSDSYGLVGNRELVMHRVFQAMQIKGPYPTVDVSTGELVAADQYYAEEYNGTDAPVAEKGSYVKIA